MPIVRYIVWVGTSLLMLLFVANRFLPDDVLSGTFAAVAAVLWFMSAGVRLRKASLSKRGLETGLDDPRLLLRLAYEQSQLSAWAAIAAGLAAIFAIADGLAR
jgi:hypothetical protein